MEAIDMVVLLVILAALATLIVGWVLDQTILLYAAVALSGAGIVVLYSPTLVKRLKERRLQKAEQGEQTVTGDTAEALPQRAGAAPDGRNDAGDATATAGDGGVDETTDGRADTDDSGLDVPAGSPVYVVPGRKRYHRPDCQLIDGKGGDELVLEEAQEEGFTACTVCISSPQLSATSTISSA